jgi:hypothetical protein
MSETCTVRPELIEFDKGNSQYLTIVAYPGADGGFKFTSTDAATASMSNVVDGAELSYSDNLANLFAESLSVNTAYISRLEGLDTIALQQGSALDMNGGDVSNIGTLTTRAVNGNSIIISDNLLDMNETGDISRVNELKFFGGAETDLLTIQNDSIAFGKPDGTLNMNNGLVTAVKTLQMNGSSSVLDSNFGSVTNVQSLSFKAEGSASGNVFLDMNQGEVSNVAKLLVGNLELQGNNLTNNDGVMYIEGIMLNDKMMYNLDYIQMTSTDGILNMSNGRIDNAREIVAETLTMYGGKSINFGGSTGSLELGGATATANISSLNFATNQIKNLVGDVRVEDVVFNANAVSSVNTLSLVDNNSSMNMTHGTVNNLNVLNMKADASTGGSINMNGGTLTFGGSQGSLNLTGNNSVARVGDLKLSTNHIENESGSVRLESAVFTGKTMQALQVSPLDGENETNVFDAKFESTKMTVENVHADVIQPKTASDLTLTTPASLGTINVSSKRVTNVATPVNDSDAANKYYVQQALQQNVQGLKPKTAVDHAALSTEWSVDKLGYSNYFVGHTPNVDSDGNNNGLLTIYLKEATDGNIDGSIVLDGVRISRADLNAAAQTDATGIQPKLAHKRVLFNGLNLESYAAGAEVPASGSSNLPADTFAATEANVAGLNGIWEIVRMGTTINGDASSDRVQIASTAYWPLVLKRSLDMNENHEIMNGAYAYIKNGSSGVKNYGFVVTNDDPLALEQGITTKNGVLKELNWVLFNNVNYELAFKTEQGAEFEELSTTNNTARFGKGGLLMRYDAADEKSIMVNTELLQYDTTIDTLNVKGNLDFSTLTTEDTFVTCGATNFIDIMGSRFRAGAAFETQDIVTNTVTCESDKTLKKNIEPMADGIGLVSKLRPVTYNWKTDEESKNIEYGFIAQEVEENFPSLVRTNGETGIKSVDYQKMVSLLALSVQELSQQVSELKSKLSA